MVKTLCLLIWPLLCTWCGIGALDLPIQVIRNSRFIHAAVKFTKCCPIGQSFWVTPENISTEFNCTDVDTFQNNTVVIIRNQSIQLEGIPIHGKNNCTTKSVIVPYQLSIFGDSRSRDIKFSSKENTILTRVSGNHPWEELKGPICLDKLITSAHVQLDPTSTSSYAIMYCDATKQFQGESLATILTVYLVALVVSSFFLSLIVIVYAALYDKQTAHGWTIATFALCQLSWFILITVGIYHSLYLREGDTWGSSVSTFCVVLSVLIHFFNVASFSWMTVLNFDVWWTLRTLMPPGADRTKRLKRFSIYSYFGFGVPSVVVTISLLLENKFGVFDDTVIRPQYGRQRCYLDDTALLYHEFIVLITLFAISMTFGLLTCVRVWRYQRQKKQFKFPNSVRENQQSRASRFGKLLIIVGMTWIFESVSNIVVGFNATWYWAVFDLYNILQAVGLFWIFVCRKDIKEQLCKKFPSVKRTFEFAEGKACCGRHAKSDQDDATTPNATIDT